METPGSPSKPLTAEGAIVGTLPYMAPEQVEGKEADARSDIFALGAILYEMATGRRAFEGTTKASLVAAILTQQPALLAELASGGSSSSSPGRNLAPVERVVRQCLEKDPDRRWQSALDVANEVRRVGEGVAADPRRSPRAASRRLRRMTVAAGALIVLLGAATAVLGWRQLHQVKPPPRPTPKLTQLTWEKGTQSSAAISPDGANFAYTGDAAGNRDIYFRRIGGEVAINLTEDCREADLLPSFSPDGNSIVYRSECDGGGLFVIGATGESKRRLTDFGQLPDWSPDGKSIVFTGNPGVWVVDAAGGTPRQLVGENTGWGHWSPTGARIVFHQFRPDGKIAIATMAVTGGTPTVVYELSGTHFGPLDWSRGWIWFSSLESGTKWIWRVPVDDETGERTGDPEPVTIGAADSSTPSLTPDGRRLLFWGGFFNFTLERRELDPERGGVVGDPRVIASGPVNVEFKWPSPDGRSIAIILWDNDGENIGLLDAGTGARRRLTDGAPQKEPIAWAPDGSKIYFNRESVPSEVWSVRPDGSGFERVAVGAENKNIYGVGISPNGRWLYAVAGDGPGLSVVDLSLPFAKRVAAPLPPTPDGKPFVIDVDYFESVSPDGKSIVGRAGSNQGPSEAEALVFGVESKSYRKLALPPGTQWYGWLSDSCRLLTLREHQLIVLDTLTGLEKAVGAFDPKSEYPALSFDRRALYTQRTDSHVHVYMLDFGVPQ
jgi:serine/threonine-protein kinase